MKATEGRGDICAHWLEEDELSVTVGQVELHAPLDVGQVCADVLEAAAHNVCDL